jgi:hypothetical protein
MKNSGIKGEKERKKGKERKRNGRSNIRGVMGTQETLRMKISICLESRGVH